MVLSFWGFKKGVKKGQKAPKQHKNKWFGAFWESKKDQNGVGQEPNRVKK